MTNSAILKLVGAVLLSSFTPACGPVEPVGTPGALKQGGFTYCDGASAGYCGSEATVPDRLAVQSTFTIQFSDTSGDVTLSSSDTTRLEELATNDDGSLGLRAAASGSAQVEARSTSKRDLIDFVRLDLEDIDSLALRLCPRGFNAISPSATSFSPEECGGDPAGNSSIEISQGSSLAPTVCVFPVGSDGDLAGHLTFGWAMNEGGTAELEMFVSEDKRCATIGGLTTGTGSITVSGGATSSVLDVTVSP